MSEQEELKEKDESASTASRTEVGNHVQLNIQSPVECQSSSAVTGSDFSHSCVNLSATLSELSNSYQEFNNPESSTNVTEFHKAGEELGEDFFTNIFTGSAPYTTSRRTFNSHYTNPCFADHLKRDGYITNSEKKFEESIRERITDFLMTFEEKLEFEPMTRQQRAFVHHAAYMRGLKTHSTGSGPERRVIIRRMQHYDSRYADQSDTQEFNLGSKQRDSLVEFIMEHPVTDMFMQLHLSQGYSARSRAPLRKSVESHFIPPMLNEQNLAMQQFRKRLPVYELRGEIMNVITSNNVTIVVGGTGCGKTTQVPQFILEHATRNRQPIRIYCTQPRRLPAVAVATRVAKERNEKLGTTVGYHIRLEQKTSANTILTYCTSGVLLRVLANDSSTENISHIILDEIHEREQNTDFLLITLREALKIRPNLKVILMSATMEENKALFKNYFSKFKVGFVDVPSTLFKVDVFHLPQILALTAYRHQSTFTEGSWDRKVPKSLNCCTGERYNSFPTVGVFHCETSGNKSYASKLKDQKEHIPVVSSSASFDSSSEASGYRSFPHENTFPPDGYGYANNRAYKNEHAMDTTAYEAQQKSYDYFVNRQAVPNYPQLDGQMPAANFIVSQMYGWPSVYPQFNFPPLSLCEESMPPQMRRPQYSAAAAAHSVKKNFLHTSNSVQDFQMSQDKKHDFYVPELPCRPPFFDPSCLKVLRETKLDTLFLTDRYMIEGGEQWTDSIDKDLVVALIHYCMGSSIDGSILVFLPGYDDILEVKEKIVNMRVLNKQAVIFMLHSQIGNQDQQKVFEPADWNCRKVILSTNIAEASLTIDDVVFVIDCGKVKEMNYDHSSRINQLKVVSIAKSSAEQRAGRAGRCRNGYCFRLYTNEDYMDMNPSQIPEMKRIAIHEVCLHAKMFAPRGISVRKFLSWAPEPPLPDSVEKSLAFLHQLGALFSKNPSTYGNDRYDREEDAELTELGYHIARLPLDPQLARLLLFGLALKCLEPTISLVAALSYREPFVLPLSADIAERTSAAAARDSFAQDGFSDHLTLLRAFYDFNRTNIDEQARFCNKNYLSYSSMKMIAGIRLQLFHELRRLRLLPTNCTSIWDADLNLYSCSWPMVQAAIVAGCYPGIGVTRTSQIRKIHTSSEIAYLNQGCVLKRFVKKDKTLPIIEHLAFQELKQSGNNITIRTVTAVSPLAVLFFAGPLKLQQIVVDTYELGSELVTDKDDETSLEPQGHLLYLEPWLPFLCAYEDLRLLLKFRIRLMHYFFDVMKNPLGFEAPEYKELLEKLNFVLVEDQRSHRFPFCEVINDNMRPSNPRRFCDSSRRGYPSDFMGEKRQQKYFYPGGKKSTFKESSQETSSVIVEQETVTHTKMTRWLFPDNFVLPQMTSSKNSNFTNNPGTSDLQCDEEMPSPSSNCADMKRPKNPDLSTCAQLDESKKSPDLLSNSVCNGVVASKNETVDEEHEEQIPDDPCGSESDADRRYVRRERCVENCQRNNRGASKVGEFRKCPSVARDVYRSNQYTRPWRRGNFDRKRDNFNNSAGQNMSGWHSNASHNQTNGRWERSDDVFSGSRTFFRGGSFPTRSTTNRGNRFTYRRP